MVAIDGSIGGPCKTHSLGLATKRLSFHRKTSIQSVGLVYRVLNLGRHEMPTMYRYLSLGQYAASRQDDNLRWLRKWTKRQGHSFHRRRSSGSRKLGRALRQA